MRRRFEFGRPVRPTLMVLGTLTVLGAVVAVAASLGTLTSQKLTGRHDTGITVPNPTSTFTFGADQDSWTDFQHPTTNHGTDTTILVDPLGNNKFKWSWVRFNISTLTCPTITAATLKLVMTTAPGSSRTHAAHRAETSWTESGVTWSTQPYADSEDSYRTTLATGITNSVTTLSVADASGFPAAPFTIQVDQEQVRVGAKSGTSFSSLTRGFSGTAASHSAGAPITQVASTSLSSSITSTSTSLTVSSAAELPPPPFNIVIDTETIKVYRVSGTTLSSLVRGLHGSTPASHASSATVKLFTTTALSADITNSGTTSISVVDASAFPAVPFQIVIDTELMNVTTKTATTLTVGRGYHQSTPTMHTSGARVLLYSPTATASTGTSTPATISWNVTNDVQLFRSGVFSNNGWRVWDNTDDGSSSNQAIYASKENTTTANRPSLVVTCF